MSKGRIVIISGPSGSGKTTLYKMLLQSSRLKKKLVRSISATTRLPRKGEKNGREYLFISPKMFEYKIKSGHFLEWQKVFDNYYGTPKKNVKCQLAQGKHVLLCIDVKGAKIILKNYPNALTIFIKTRSLSILKKRLESRGQDNPESRNLRLKTATNELKESKNYSVQIINDRLDVAFRDLEDAVIKELLDVS